jgi:hypothetical protein
MDGWKSTFSSRRKYQKACSGRRKLELRDGDAGGNPKKWMVWLRDGLKLWKCWYAFLQSCVLRLVSAPAEEKSVYD